MATNSSDESTSSEISKEIPTRISNYDVGKLHEVSFKHRQRVKHKHEGDYNTFVVPEILCQCQQKCTERVTPSLIQKISMYYFGLRGNKEKQKSYLASLILGKEKQIDINAMKGKRVRKMSYRYFVPILTDKDLKDQSEENIASVASQIKNKRKIGKSIINPMFDDKNWDHIEVCLKAFTSVHIISEKKVIVTRSICQLNTTIRCSKPFHKDNIHSVAAMPEKHSNNNKFRAETTNVAHTVPGTSDIGAQSAAWLMRYNNSCQNITFPVNPKTFLPVGLVLPESMICLPIFSDSDYIASDPDRDVDIIDNFFFNQLWKPEYMSDCGHISNPKKM